MAKKKKGKKKKGKKKGKKGKKTSARVAPYYPVVLTADYKFGNIICKQIADTRKHNDEAAQRVRDGGILISERSDSGDARSDQEGGESRLLSLARLTLDELPLGLSTLASTLTALDLSGNRLFDIQSIGASLRELREIREINLNSNNLTGPLPSLNLPHLELLSANHNQITALPDSLATESPKLITLSLQNNSLLHFSELYSTVWTELRVLNLSKNKLTQLPANIGEYKSLEVLKASQNTIAILPDSIGNCKHLTTLCIDENAILSLPIELEKNQHLKTLNVSKNGLTRIDGNLLKALGTSGLRNLYCYKNKISSLPPSIGHIGTLQILSISNNKLTKLPDEIGGLEQLLELYVGGNVGLKAIPATCKGWKSIQALYAQSCTKLKSLPLQLAWCRTLRDLNVLSAKKKQTCVVYRSLLDSIPGLKLRGGKVKKDKKKKGGGGNPMLPPPHGK